MWGLGAIARVLCDAYGVDATALRRRGPHANEARRVAMALAKALTTESLRSQGERFGGVGPAAVSNTLRQLAAARRAWRRLAKLLRRCRQANALDLTAGSRSVISVPLSVCFYPLRV